MRLGVGVMIHGGIQTRPVITDKQRNGQLTMTRIKTGKEGHQGTLNYLVPHLIVQARGVISARNEIEIKKTIFT